MLQTASSPTNQMRTTPPRTPRLGWSMDSASRRLCGVGVAVRMGEKPAYLRHDEWFPPVICLVHHIPEGGMAWADGTMRVNDALVRVDGEDVRTKNLDEIRDLILGPSGSKIELELARFLQDGSSVFYAICLTRAPPNVMATSIGDDQRQLRQLERQSEMMQSHAEVSAIREREAVRFNQSFVHMYEEKISTLETLLSRERVARLHAEQELCQMRERVNALKKRLDEHVSRQATPRDCNSGIPQGGRGQPLLKVAGRGVSAWGKQVNVVGPAAVGTPPQPRPPPPMSPGSLASPVRVGGLNQAVRQWPYAPT